MKKAILIISIMVATVAFAYAAVAVPDKVNLKTAWGVEGKQKAVTFDHALHSNTNTCTECHATDAGGKWKPTGTIAGMNNKNPAHQFCWESCHVEKKVSVGKVCTKCHKG
ncbi:MAG: cytochrome C [Deferribacteraceae bacterium]|jgi:cytochrome c553|nr:cytochrome C [Deferribacteraceae bacterium]